MRPDGPFTGEAAEVVSAELGGLHPGIHYVFRLVGSNVNGSLGSNENGSAPGQVASFETPPAFTVVTGSTNTLTPTSVTMTGSVNPQGLPVAECFFEYGTTESYGHLASCESPDGPEIGTGNAPVAVHANVKGLAPNTKYDFRLIATSSEFGRVPGANASVETLGPPRITDQSFSGIGQDGVTVSGSVDPDGESTIYAVEYVSGAALRKPATRLPVRFLSGARASGSGREPVAVSEQLTGLAPATSYHFRLTASNDAGSASGPDQAFTTQAATPLFGPCLENEAFRVGPSAALPDCRAYEQASPVNKNGDSAAGLYPLTLTSEDGSAVTFYSPAGAMPHAERGGAQDYATYLQTRSLVGGGSWSGQRLLPPEQFGEQSEFLGVTPDMRYAIVEAGTAGANGLFVIDTKDGSVTQIAPYHRIEGKRKNEFGFDGASVDGSRIFFESETVVSTTPAEPAAVTGHDNLYVWDRVTGDVSLVGVLPAGEGGAAPADGSFGGSFEWYEQVDPTTGGALNTVAGDRNPMAIAALHAISPDGSKIDFTAAGTGQLYLRRGLNTATPSTVRISAPNPGVTDPHAPAPAAFQEAALDGSRAFFLSAAKLTANATTGPEDEGLDLYRWDTSSEALVDIATDRRDTDGAEIQGLLGVNSDGTSGYFIARGVLAAGAARGKENLYRFAEESAGHFSIAFIATLAHSGPQEVDRRNVSPKTSFTYDFAKTARVSEDGETCCSPLGRTSPAMTTSTVKARNVARIFPNRRKPGVAQRSTSTRRQPNH